MPSSIFLTQEDELISLKLGSTHQGIISANTYHVDDYADAIIMNKLTADKSSPIAKLISKALW